MVPLIIQKSCLLSFCVYRSPTTSLFCAEFLSVCFLLCLITGSVSHIWSIYHSKSYLADIGYRGMTFYKACPSDIGG